jgi:hypothetical protein
LVVLIRGGENCGTRHVYSGSEESFETVAAPSSATPEFPRQYDLIRVIAFGLTLWATVSLAYLVGSSIRANDKYEIGYL